MLTFLGLLICPLNGTGVKNGQSVSIKTLSNGKFFKTSIRLEFLNVNEPPKEKYAPNFNKIFAVSKLSEQQCIKKPFLILEPGRSIVGEAGITLYTVGAIKEIEGVKNYVAINGGMFENPRYALYQAKYTVVKANEVNSLTKVKYSIAGKCCESGDIIAEDVMLPKAEKGDVLAVLSTGAYNYSMASNYNRNLIPPVVMVKDGKTRYAVKPQTYEDLVRNDV